MNQPAAAGLFRLERWLQRPASTAWAFASPGQADAQPFAKGAGFTASDLKVTSLTHFELRGADFTLSDLKGAGVTASELKVTGLTHPS